MSSSSRFNPLRLFKREPDQISQIPNTFQKEQDDQNHNKPPTPHNPDAPSPSAQPNDTFNVQILSDLHLELPRPSSQGSYTTYQYDFPVTAPNLALLGDIGCTIDPGLFEWLDTQLLRYELVLYVAGNHEPYRSTFAESYTRLEKYAKKNKGSKAKGKFIFFNQTRYDISDTLTILGCTLWAAIDPDFDKRAFIGITLNDFRKIKGFDVDQSVKAHQKDLQWLESTIEQIRREQKETGQQRRIVVLTHHVPTVQDATHPKYYQSPTISAFATELSQKDWWSSPLVFWAFGHTHYSCDFVRNGVRIYSNQRGHRGTDDTYAPDKVVEL